MAAPTTPKRPRTILAVQSQLNDLIVGVVKPHERIECGLSHCMALLADANRAIEKLEARPERITVACPCGYVSVAYEADDLRTASLNHCLRADGWDPDRSLCPKCRAEYHGPDDACDVLAPAESE